MPHTAFTLVLGRVYHVHSNAVVLWRTLSASWRNYATPSFRQVNYHELPLQTITLANYL